MPFDHNDHYHRLILRQLPRDARTALDVGCGTGRFARQLAHLGLEVDAVDRSEDVVSVARAVSGGAGGPQFRRADLAEVELPQGHYDVITCLASLHHMPFDTLAALRDALAPGGVLVVLGCYAEQSRADMLWSTAAAPVNAGARLTVAVKEAILHDSAAARAERTRPPVQQPVMTLAQIRQDAATMLPGCTIRRLLFWRYLLVFRNGARGPQPGPTTPEAPRANGSGSSAQGIDE